MRKSLFFLLVLCCSCASLKYDKHPEYEFRGTWVATVVNIDWPKSGKDSAEQQKKDFLKLLDFYETLNLNTLIVQIRTAGDAFFPSEMAPWSRFMTGQEGQPKDGFNDPLKWMVEKTHERGMQFHAWLNPYRATFDLDTTILAENHDFNQHRDWMIKYGKKFYYDPGNRKVQQHLTRIVGEVVENYAVDGIHFDDYFYPYKIKDEFFNDTITYATNALPDQSLEDWRRSNIDTLIRQVHTTIKTKKPWVRFGVSPFGVWKNQNTDPKGSATSAGQTTYDDLYADPLVWIQNGWLDYIVPQIYWSMNYPAASHQIIADWWAQNTSNTNLYIGNGVYKYRNNADEAWNDVKEIPKQLALARNTQEISGNVFFSAKSLINANNDINKQLQKKFYSKKASHPSMVSRPIRNITEPIISETKTEGKQVGFTISHYDSVPRFLSVYQFNNVNKANKAEVFKKTYISKDKGSKTIVLKNLRKRNLGFRIEDAYGNQSKMTIFPKTKATKQK